MFQFTPPENPGQPENSLNLSAGLTLTIDNHKFHGYTPMVMNNTRLVDRRKKIN